jgi:hypothetical protein
MKRKILSISVVFILIILGATTVSNAKMSLQNTANNRQIGANRVIELGTADVYGDGIEPNTEVDAVCTLASPINLDSASEIVDLELTFDIQAEGENDIALIIVFAQLNGASVGEDLVATTESESGTLSIKDVELKKIDVITLLTVEVAALYLSNSDPTFYQVDLDTGLAIIRPKSKNIESRIQSVPLIQSLLNLPKIARVFN